MKSFRISSILIAALLFTAASCKKPDNSPANYFSFKGKNYEITSAFIDKDAQDTVTGLHMDLYLFRSITTTDTAELYLGASDLQSIPITGNFPSLDISSQANRQASCLLFLPDKSAYESGPGGSVDIALSGVTYSLHFNGISAGVYTTGLGGVPQYTEADKIGGRYSGVPVSANIITYNARTNSFFQKIGLNRKAALN